ncbi:MAG: hypothetical protein OEY49_16370 [Candidatus Heimdallarchaeota archaeon]|nr:hypothetical protein [Candidatus Heimdallarchaeota archaeon]
MIDHINTDYLEITIIKELYDILEFTNSTLPTLTSEERKDIMEMKVNRLKVVYNSFFSNPGIDLENQKKVFVEAVDFLTFIVNNLQHFPELQNSIMNLISLSNLIRSALISFHNSSNSIVELTSADILSSILIDQANELKILPEFPPYNQLKEFSSLFSSFFNMVYSTTSIYRNLLMFIPIIHKSDLISWLNSSFNYFKLFIDLFEIYDVDAILKTKKVENLNVFFNSTYTIINSFSNLSDLFLTSHRLLNGKWENIEAKNLLETYDLSGIHQFLLILLEKLKVKNDQLFESLLKYYPEVTEKPASSVFYADYAISSDFTNFTIAILKYFNVKENTNENDSMQLIDNIINIGCNTIERILEIVGGKNEIWDHYQLSNVTSFLTDIIQFATIKSTIINDPAPFEQIISSYEDLINYSRGHNKNYELKEILCKLTLYSHDQIDLDTILLNLNQIHDDFRTSPRDYVALLILKQLIQQSLGLNPSRIDLSEIKYHYNDDLSYNKELESYFRYLEDGTEVPSELVYRQELFELDLNSLIKPIFKLKDGRILKYLPFNLMKDIVVL